MEEKNKLEWGVSWEKVICRAACGTRVKKNVRVDVTCMDLFALLVACMPCLCVHTVLYAYWEKAVWHVNPL